MNWETIDDNTLRAKIHKGWLVKHFEIITVRDTDNEIVSKAPHFSICFVEDSMHSWRL